MLDLVCLPHAVLDRPDPVVPQIASPVARGFAVQAKAVALNDKVGRPSKQSASNDLEGWLHSI